MDEFKLIGKLVRFHRKKAKLTQNELAAHASIGKTVVFDIEKGKETVQLNSLLKVFHALNIQLHFISPLMNDFKNDLYEAA